AAGATGALEGRVGSGEEHVAAIYHDICEVGRGRASRRGRQIAGEGLGRVQYRSQSGRGRAGEEYAVPAGLSKQSASRERNVQPAHGSAVPAIDRAGV